MSTPNIEVLSEIVCWTILAALVQIAGCRGSNGVRSAKHRRVLSRAVVSTRSWLFALGITVACWYRAEERTVFLYPILTPLLISGIRPTVSNTINSRIRWALFTTRWNSVLIATFSCFALVASSQPDYPELALCSVVIALLCVANFALARLWSPPQANADLEISGDKQLERDGSVGIKLNDEFLLSLALTTLPLLVVTAGVRSMIFHKPKGSLIREVAIGAVKALSWHSTLRAAQSSSWCVVATIGSFAITSTRNTLAAGQLWYLYAAWHIVAALLSLCQTIRLSVGSTKLRSNLWWLAVVPFVSLLANMHGIDKLLQLRESHPIEVLARAAELRFEAMVARQSRTYVAAETEYRRRYGIEPPPGFEAWYNFTIAHKSPIIDEFDTINEAVSPFLKMTGLQVRKVMAGTNDISHVDLWRCELNGQIKELTCTHPFRTDTYIKGAFERWTKQLTVELPDMVFLANYLDEPRVMLSEGSASEDKVLVSDISRRPIWDKLTATCPQAPKVNIHSGLATLDGSTYGLPFVTDTYADKDLCRHPEYRDMHGLVISPSSLILIEGVVPVLTPGTVSTMGDVLYPSPSSMGEGFVYEDSDDMEWDKKKSNLYWAGSTTGAYAGDGGWKRYHRQRFVALARGLDRGKKYWYLRLRDGVFRRVSSTVFREDLFDVAFTSAIQCDEGICETQRRYFDMQGRADQNKPFGSKLVFDLDGNGISGRFNKLLASRSAVLKQTLLREWHDERLIPWVHYLPVSQDLGELPEMVVWLIEAEDGKRRAKNVADQGREWAARAMREEDRAIYVFRLLLELARIQDPDRKAM
ncbi:hypothetical protein PCL_07015 [Purpureocillium lilacinum]|uniref:Glycosyl transferase CAP10 domain-containing protein n=1 Tax=Purpureocillium lilacinum TaxID=33203 RepID=A0A2U3DT51_PURLI|nr:hypothetical protein PCL_07015 [Purpureocillium lilacinum]